MPSTKGRRHERRHSGHRPAGGRCVRLVQGRPDAETVYADDPVAVARSLCGGGRPAAARGGPGRRLRGAAAQPGRGDAIVRRWTIPVQLGGGIRDMAAVDEVLGGACSRLFSAPPRWKTPSWWRRRAGSIRAGSWWALTPGTGKRPCGAGWKTPGWTRWSWPGRWAELGVRRNHFHRHRPGRHAARAQRGGPGADGAAGPARHRLRRRQQRGRRAGLLSRIPGVSGVIIGKAVYTGACDLEEAALAAAAGPAGGPGTGGCVTSGRARHPLPGREGRAGRQGRALPGIQRRGGSGGAGGGLRPAGRRRDQSCWTLRPRRKAGRPPAGRGPPGGRRHCGAADGGRRDWRVEDMQRPFRRRRRPKCRSAPPPWRGRTV